MKAITSLTHSIVGGLRLENLFAFLGKDTPFFNKFIPHPSHYQSKPQRVVIRDRVKFDLDVSDYMQWHVFAHLPDYSWKKAADFLQPESHVLDIGANCGAFSLKLAQKAYENNITSATIHAFDPNPYIVQKLTHNLSLNPQLDNLVKVHAIGLGAENVEAPMVFSEANTGGAKVLGKEAQGQVMVQIKKIDDFVSENQLDHISFIKIDVEGYEPFVFLGARETIRKFRPAMYIEITDEWFKAQGYSKEFIFNLLLAENYELLVEREHKFIDIAAVKNQLDQIPQFNLLALPQTNNGA
ncbi:MAG TPA: hypothetical protein DCS93_41130 [Microscillaceae bacterium]|nr:hypothetical protein [Microscillaceae bacterium]